MIYIILISDGKVISVFAQTSLVTFRETCAQQGLVMSSMNEQHEAIFRHGNEKCVLFIHHPDLHIIFLCYKTVTRLPALALNAGIGCKSYTADLTNMKMKNTRLVNVFDIEYI